ncbi:MAG TPA: hypothetical protein VKE51_25845 [Vicinamibacterales bacterium]|nr:hypothetical protein [Vicinamibacterales bacterium]
MIEPSDSGDSPNRSRQSPYRVRLPGFVVEEDIGLGDVIKRATSYVGLKPCESCVRRAAALNRRVVFTGGAR